MKTLLINSESRGVKRKLDKNDAHLPQNDSLDNRKYIMDIPSERNFNQNSIVLTCNDKDELNFNKLTNEIQDQCVKAIARLFLIKGFHDYKQQ